MKKVSAKSHPVNHSGSAFWIATVFALSLCMGMPSMFAASVKPSPIVELESIKNDLANAKKMIAIAQTLELTAAVQKNTKQAKAVESSISLTK